MNSSQTEVKAGTGTQRVAIVIPLSSRPSLTADEEISLRHVTRYLGDYDRFLVKPPSVSLRVPGFDVREFGDQFFGSQQAYTRLLLSRRFYETFGDYEYMLVYHLDALVFSDQLQAWCDAGYDYIGPPWLKSKTAPEQGFSGVGNGGFSLRRIPSLLRVMDSQKAAIEPGDYWKKYFASAPWPVRVANRPRWLLKHLPRFNNVRRELAYFWRDKRFGEDHFWAYRAPHFDPHFRLAPPDVALRFAFQEAPRYCFELLQSLPFGCHAWGKFDRQFWEPYLLIK